MVDNTDISNLYDIIITKASILNPKFQGRVEGISKDMIGLERVDNTSDLEKKISSATKIVLDTKAPSDNPTFTGIPIAPTPNDESNPNQIATTEFVKKATENLADIEERLTNIHFNPFNSSTIIGGNLISKNLTTDTLTTANLTATNLVYSNLIIDDLTINKNIVIKEYDSFKEYLNINNVDNVPDLEKPISVNTQNALDLKLDKSIYESNYADLITDINLKATTLSPALTGIPTAPTVDSSTSTDQLATTKFVHNLAQSLNTKTTNIIYDTQTNITKIKGDVMISNLIITGDDDNISSNVDDVGIISSLTQIATKINSTYKLDLNHGNMFYIESNNLTNNCGINIINLPIDRISIINIKLFFKTKVDRTLNSYLTKVNAINKNSIYVKGSLDTFENITCTEVNYNQTSNLTVQTFIIMYDPILTDIFNIKSDVTSY